MICVLPSRRSKNIKDVHKWADNDAWVQVKGFNASFSTQQINILKAYISQRMCKICLKLGILNYC